MDRLNTDVIASLPYAAGSGCDRYCFEKLLEANWSADE
jgi:hypothetical protein